MADIEPDSPPYPIVQACNAVGVQKAEDVRWIKLPQCPCAKSPPRLQPFRFTYSSGQEVLYSVGQCPKCHTVYWQDCK